MNTTQLLLAVLVLAAVAGSGSAQTSVTEHTLALSDTTARPHATLAEVSWLVGSWRGPGLGGETDEIWLPAAGGQMPGMFRFLMDGEPVFYELWVLREVNESLVLELRHFNPDLSGWEAEGELTTFPLVRVEESAAYFDGLTYSLKDEDMLQIWLALSEDGVVREETFRLTRVPVGE